MATTTTLTNKPINPRANDLSPKGYNRASLYSGKALDFDGVNDYVSVGDVDNLSFGNGTTDSPFSITGYFNLEVLGTNKTIAAKDNGSQREYSLFVNSSNKLRFFLKNNGGADQQSIDSDLVLESGKWYFVSATYDGRGGSTAYEGLNIYVNGQLTGVDSYIANTYTAMANTPAGFAAGLYSSNFMNGQLSNIKVFGSELTAAQVADLYLNPEKIVPTGVANSALKLWLPMMEGAGTTAYDGSGNGNHGTISGATWTSGVGAPVAQTALVGWNKGTNKISNSLELTVSNFSFNETTSTGGYTAPDGTDTAYKITKGAGTSQYVIQGSVAEGDDYRAIYARTTSGTGTINLMTYGGNTNNLFTITEEWQKFTLNSVTTSTAEQNFYLCDFRFSATLTEVVLWAPNASNDSYNIVPTLATAQTSPVLLPQGLTANKDITGVNSVSRNAYALNLDGASWAEVHDNASLDVSEISVECWFDNTNAYDSIRYLFDKSNGATSGFELRLTSQTGVQLVFRNLSTISKVATIPSSGWVHVVGIYDGSDIILYVNGVFGASVASSGSIGVNNDVLTIGGDNTFALYSINKPIALPRIYNRALTATEVARNYNADKSKFGL
jgi:hypothetical protein